MQKYKIIRTDTADYQLHHIVLGIAENFGADAALEKLDYIEKQISCLGENPDIGTAPRYMVLKRQGYKVLIFEKDLVFYKVDHKEQIVTIHAVLDQRQDYVSIILGM